MTAELRLFVALLASLALATACEAPPPGSDGHTPTDPMVVDTPAQTPNTPDPTPHGPDEEWAVVGTPVPAVVQAVEDLQPPLEGTLHISLDSYGGGGASVNRAEDGAVGWIEQVEAAIEGFCGVASCAHHEVEHSREGSRDMLTSIATRGLDQSSAVYRVGMDNLRSTFTMTGFDFSTLPGSKCVSPPSVTCGAPPAVGLLESCRVAFAHAFEITLDDPSRGLVSMIIADHFGARLVGVSLDYKDENTCAQVSWVMDNTDPLWVPSCEPNSLQMFSHEGADHLLVTCRNTDHQNGAGRIVLYRLAGDLASPTRPSFERLWVYPYAKDLNSEANTLGSPHDARLNRAAGGWALSYAHTAGLSDDRDFLGKSTVGLAWLGALDQPPTYLADLYLNTQDGQQPLRIVTTVDWHEPGWFMVADSSNYVTSSSESGNRRLLFEISHPAASGLSGAWSSEHRDQNLVPLNDALVLEAPCSSAESYQLVWLTEDVFGDTLKQTAAAPAFCQSAP